ncbi:lipocalin-like domain-containing protein [Boseongicola aestuarii]|uniref:Hydroxyneurosporene synthase (CrtC) n=1 Tax=Boseongicola aestuarii TaxID=1470561 RepID=A0A238IZN3_9RHOB|nr:lipocalin-like domain-containing protein [Boseongicola aestuarii]SMX23847.1 Hydroxyneurosporene synthase (CrtC) [Boseongicola aestuarii]
MSVKIFLTILMTLAVPVGLKAQGFAGMGADADGYALPDPASRFKFPEDHGAHLNFRIEWWYVTSVMKAANGDIYGAQWTLFRNAIRPTGQSADQIWLGHAAVSTPQGHFHSERIARGGVGQAGVTAAPFLAEIDEWKLAGPSPNNMTVSAQGTDFAYELTLEAIHPFVPQGRNGFSQKSASGMASHYFSQPFYTVRGTIDLPSGPVAVTGQAWMDREWSSQPLTPSQTGWDWFSLHLDSGEKFMGYRLRDTQGEDYIVGTWITVDGRPDPLEPGELTLTPRVWARVEDRDLPVGWTIELPERDFSVNVNAVYPQSWMPTIVPYWEGPVTIEGSHRGLGYLEMTGYE